MTQPLQALIDLEYIEENLFRGQNRFLGPRRAIVALFLLLGEHDPAVRKYRPTFNRSLY